MSETSKTAGNGFPRPDPEIFARNIARVLDEAGLIAREYGAPRDTGDSLAVPAELAASITRTLGNVAQNWLSDPRRAVRAQMALWQDYMELWSRSVRRMTGEAVEPVIEPDKADKRFRDPDWSENQFFDFIKQSYLITARWADGMVGQAQGIDDHTRLKADFYVKQLANALSPSNFLFTNPDLLRQTLETNGENLVRGMKMLHEDLKRGGGEFRMRQTDPDAFEVGRNLALTPGKVVFQNDLMQLIQYAPSTEQVYKRPLLIVPPWINKFYILDLTPEKSLIKWCVDQGFTTFVVSWVNPDKRLAAKTFEDYMREGVLGAIGAVEQATGEDRIDVVGYCIGGTMLAATLAWMAASKDKRAASATFLAAQSDFTFAGDLKVFVDEDQIGAIEEEMRVKGFLSSNRMATAFNMLRSNDLLWPYLVNNYLKGQAPFPFDLLHWNSDSTRLPAANHSFYLRKCYLENALSLGRMELAGKPIDLSKVRVPVYNLATKEDHISPAKSVFLSGQFFGGKVRYVLSGSGHIAGVVNPEAKGKYQYWTGGPAKGAFEDWMKTAKEHPGSWWPDWRDWLTGLDGKMVPARTPGDGKLKTIEDAPGSYVRARA